MCAHLEALSLDMMSLPRRMVLRNTIRLLLPFEGPGCPFVIMRAEPNDKIAKKNNCDCKGKNEKS